MFHSEGLDFKMRTRLFSTVFAMAVLVAASVAQAQSCNSCGTSAGFCGIGSSGALGADGMSIPTCSSYPGGYPLRGLGVVYAARDHFSPQPLYAYSRNGIDASRQHAWNQQQAQMYSWHGPNSYWRYNAPTAVVVPPTAAFQSEYNWGVGQTRSLPIYHQFGFANGGGEGNGTGVAPGTPYWPSSTGQMGLYPVRGPWN